MVSLEGVWRAEYAGFSGEITIPGTLDESGIGHEDVGTNSWHPDQVPGNGAALREGPIATRLTRRRTCEGAIYDYMAYGAFQSEQVLAPGGY